MNYTFVQRLQVNPVDPDRLSDQCGRIMDELADLGVADPLIGGNMSTGEVEISVMVDADSYLEAVQKAMTVIRTAIHAAEGSTPGWPRLDAAIRSIQAEEVAEAEVPLGV